MVSECITMVNFIFASIFLRLSSRLQIATTASIVFHDCSKKWSVTMLINHDVCHCHRHVEKMNKIKSGWRVITTLLTNVNSWMWAVQCRVYTVTKRRQSHYIQFWLIWPSTCKAQLSIMTWCERDSNQPKYHLTQRPRAKTTERRVIARPAPHCFKACFWSVLLRPPCHIRMGTEQGQMAADGESEVPLQLWGLGNKKLFVVGSGHQSSLTFEPFWVSIYVCPSLALSSPV